MTKFLAYVTEIERVFIQIYEAENKEQVKVLLLEDCKDYMVKVRQKRTAKMPYEERFITTIFELNEGWLNVWTQKHICLECKVEYTKLEKAQMQSRGTAEFCSEECYRQNHVRFEAPDSYDNAAVYMITHIPTGQKYIGVTTRWIMQRWWEHMKATSGSPLHQLITQDGIEAFTFQILERFKPSHFDPYAVEAHYIAKYNAKEAGLNAVEGHKLKVIDNTQNPNYEGSAHYTIK